MDERTPYVYNAFMGLRDWLRTPFSSSTPPKAPHLRVGARGEAIAERFLRKSGYAIRGKNVRLGKDEIDILAFDPADEVLVFVEVKTSAVADPDYPASLRAGHRKIRKIARAARRWVAEQEYDGGYRIDLVCVEGGTVTQHIREVAWQ